MRERPMIRLQTLGTLEVTMDGAEAPSELLWKKNVALLLYLARAPKRRCTREQLIGLLWPDKDDAAARQSVREAIRMVRHYVGDERLKTTGDVIQKEAQRESLALEPETKALVERLRSGRTWHLPKEALSPDRSVAWRRAPLLGRQRELATALGHWRTARTAGGHLGVLVLEAESGGGKTRFIEELVTR